MVTFNATNATGWAELYAGNPVLAAYTLFNTTFAGYFIIILITLFNMLLFLKSGKPMLPFVLNGLCLAFFAFTPYFPQSQIGILLILQAFYLAGILYKWFYMESV